MLQRRPIRIIRIPFTGSVKLRAILLKAGPADHTPTKIAVVSETEHKLCRYTQSKNNSALQFNNLEHLDFSEVAERKPTQEFEVPQGRDVGEYHVM